MSNKRPVVLMAILLLLGSIYFTRPLWAPVLYGNPGTPPPPLPGQNSLSGLDVHRDPKGHWIASFDYFYTGAPTYASLQIQLLAANGSKVDQYAAYKAAERGNAHADIQLMGPVTYESTTSERVVAQLRTHDKVLAQAELMQTIRWPDAKTAQTDAELEQKSTDQVFRDAVALIDKGDEGSLEHAKALLERLIAKDPRFDPAFVELARVAMKSNWSPEGLHQAENLTASALTIRPDSVDAKIMMAYIQTHQGRYKSAEGLMVEISRQGTSNDWFWADWGELLALQGKYEAAVEKYRIALTQPRTGGANDRARLDAYRHLLVLLEQRQRFDDMEPLYKQRVAEFGAEGCHGAEYARFILQKRGDANAAIVLARQSIDSQCDTARDVLGLAHYAAWADLKDAPRDEALNQARIFLPAGPRALYLLAASDRTIPAARQLIASGESLEQRDNENFNALAYSVMRKDYPAARRLMRIGARSDSLVGSGNYPVALLPAMQGDVEGVRFFLQAGVDYSKLSYQGVTAIDNARRTGDRRMLDVLERGRNSL